MTEVIFNGPEGRLEGRYQPGKEPNAQFLREIDAGAYFDLVIERIARLR